ncbi:hypothetical protein CGRA01v4_03004 [Colletotrichum graminicola]|nr:hypothetical protein CGRA01v4_03004 [Colletotrichum graminicola]
MHGFFSYSSTKATAAVAGRRQISRPSSAYCQRLRELIEADLCAVLLCRACSHIPDRCFVLQQTADAKTSSRAREGEVWVSGCRPLRRTPSYSQRAGVCVCVLGASQEQGLILARCSAAGGGYLGSRGGGQDSWQHRALPCPTPVPFRYPYGVHWTCRGHNAE